MKKKQNIYNDIRDFSWCERNYGRHITTSNWHGNKHKCSFARCTPLLASVASLITNEYFSKLKLRHSKLTNDNHEYLLYAKTLDISMSD